MPVIGRLDEQTDAVLIEPIKRHYDTGDEVEGEASAQSLPTLAQVQREQDEANADPPLPVWLL
ncbi:MAG: hypothetical protein ACRD9R_13485 [Pyrinomonadaceae bacterium]